MARFMAALALAYMFDGRYLIISWFFISRFLTTYLFHSTPSIFSLFWMHLKAYAVLNVILSSLDLCRFYCVDLNNFCILVVYFGDCPFLFNHLAIYSQISGSGLFFILSTIFSSFSRLNIFINQTLIFFCTKTRFIFPRELCEADTLSLFVGLTKKA